ncbi:MAG: alpha-D-glucose phosphate-specific phosphoglucomutase [Candidatus Rokubacteria bacterium]|nr:alpha-D-glucose phosphate-specific phosphoglucomutase [Candidatus Rokubacteria bacterium]
MRARQVHPLAGKPAPPELLVDVAKLVTAYYTERPDPSVPEQRVVFGTSGHRGSAFQVGFNEGHILAVTQAICRYREAHQIDGPLFLGWDTHALSEPARVSALEVLAANGVEVMVDIHDRVTPTPVISRAILAHNRGRTTALADGIVITPSHNPPEYGGFKYNPPSGGPADTGVTAWIEREANAHLADGLRGVARIPYQRARRAAAVHRFDYVTSYVEDLGAVIDVAVLRGTSLAIGVDPLGGASVGYWEAIGERHGFRLQVVNHEIDPTFRFMTVDWDGAIRMDPSSPYAMAGLIGLRDGFDLAFANDPDADRHGIVSRGGGLLEPNHFLAVSVDYLFRHRPAWKQTAEVGKTVVSSGIIDRVAARLGRRLVEVPVGFKYFVDGLSDGSLGFAGEESAGASFLRLDGTVWTTDKDGLIMGLLAAEMTARTGRDPGEQYQELTRALGEPVYERIDAEATPEQKAALQRLSPTDLRLAELAGEPVTAILTTAPGDGRPIGGIKVVAEHGWFAARPSGTEAVYKLYAESFKGRDHLRSIQEEASAIIQKAFEAGGGR